MARLRLAGCRWRISPGDARLFTPLELTGLMLQVTNLSKSYSVLLANSSSGAMVLDLGAGRGWFAAQLAARGFAVTAVDRDHVPADLSPAVTWIQRDISEWVGEGLPSGAYDAALLRHIIQFFDRGYVLGTLLPAVARSIKPGGVIAIETFTAPPEPPFKKNHASHWTLDELRSALPGWEELHAETVDERGPDMSGNERLFHKTTLVAMKPL